MGRSLRERRLAASARQTAHGPVLDGRAGGCAMTQDLEAVFFVEREVALLGRLQLTGQPSLVGLGEHRGEQGAADAFAGMVGIDAE